MMIAGLELTPLKIIPGTAGDVMHGIKSSEKSYRGFGEAYFSSVVNKEIKGWKKHRQMTLNLVVPVGKIKFVVYDDRADSATTGKFFEVELSLENYQRLTVPPGVWMAFQGKGAGLNLLLNIASIPHDPNEAESAALEKFKFDWK